MPRSIRIFRLVTALVTLVFVAALVRLSDLPAARVVAGLILVFGAMQWLFLGALGRRFLQQAQNHSGAMHDSPLETEPPAP